MELAPGTRIDRYVLLEPLGEGGQGAVWKAEDPLTPEQPCALKLVELKHSRPADAERVRREARALTRLQHPSLVRCLGLFEDLKRDLLGVAMELVDGTSLRHVKRDPRFGPDERAVLLRHVAHALAYVHDEGVVHRDLKPDNILVSSAFFESPADPSGIKLVDFGIAAEEGNPQPLTALDTVVGTLSFLAPEVVDPSFFKAKNSVPAVDVFAFGVLAWQLVMDTPHPTGLERASLVEYGLAYRRAAELGAAWPERLPEGAWGDLLRRCLAVVAEHRIPNGTELSAGCDLAVRTGAIVRPEAAPGSLPGSAPTAVASPGAMLGRTAEQSDAVPRSQAPTELLAAGAPEPPAKVAAQADAGPAAPPAPTPATSVPAASASLVKSAAPAGGRGRALSAGLAILALAGAGAAYAVLRDLGPTGSRSAPLAAPPLRSAAPRASASAPANEASAPPAASGVPVFSPSSALPDNCNRDAGICACCPSGRDCTPGVCGDALEVDQSWLLRPGPIRSGRGDLADAEVCVQIEGLGQGKCVGRATDGGRQTRIHVDTPDLVDRGIVVEVRAAGHSARTSVKRYNDGLKREVLCTGLWITGFEGDLEVSSLKLFLDPDPATQPAARCPDALAGGPALGQ